ncbi:MAG: sulfatase [Candidatus Hydrogenedens sp.]|jgi:arylsulfatase A-like enzyme|nr:sulfatase [Candidatus Hydrogenedens sp.]
MKRQQDPVLWYCFFSLIIVCVSVTAFGNEDKLLSCYRLDDHIDDAEILHHGSRDLSFSTSVVIWPDLEHENTDFKQDTVTIKKDLLHWNTAEASTLSLHEDIDVYAPDFDAMIITAAVEGVSELSFYWRFSLKHWLEMEHFDNCFFKLPVVADGQTRSYIVRLDNLEYWNRLDIIDGLRIKTDGQATIEIHKIELRKKSSNFADIPVGCKNIYMVGEFRQVIYAHTPASFRYRLTLPENPVFATGMNFVEEHSPVTFQVSITCDGATTSLLEEKLENNHRWLDKQYSLKAYAGKEVEVTLSASSEQAGQTVLWSNPSIYEARQDKKETRKPNILVYLVDALKANRLDAYGYDRPTAPFIKEWAKSGSLFQEYRSHETCTKASMMSLHSGIDSAAHRFTCSHGLHYKNEPPFYPALLRQEGYETCAISQNNYSPPVSLSQKMFSKLFQINPLDGPEVCNKTEQCTFEFLEKHRDRPFYLYVHTMEVHDRMEPHPTLCPLDDQAHKEIWEISSEANESEQYDAAIAYADYNFRKIYNKLADLNLLENTIVIFTSDHGEALHEHGLYGHSFVPYEHQIHIPLIMSGPGIPASVRQEEVTLTDLSATLPAMAEIAVPPVYQGRNLLTLFNGGKLNPTPTFSFLAWKQENASVIQDGWKYRRFDTDGEKLFSLQSDREELVDLSETHPEKMEAFRQLLDQHMEKQTRIFNSLGPEEESQESAISVDPLEIEILKALGYIN